MTNVQAQTTSCVSLILQAGAEGALNGVQSVVEALRLQIQNNRDVIVTELQSFTGVRRPQARRHLLLPARLPRLQQRLGEAVATSC